MTRARELSTHDGQPVVLRHYEAFCLMKYVNKATGEVEWLWNSRDGVTPLLIGFRSDVMHDDWHEDAFVPNFVPPVGMRIFIDAEPGRPELLNNVKVVVVDEALHRAFGVHAAQRPLRPGPRRDG